MREGERKVFNMRDVAIVSIARTPVGRGIKGSFRDTRPDTLGGIAFAEAVIRAKIDPKEIDDVVVGCAFPEGEQGMNPSRVVATLAGIPYETPTMTVNRFCSSGVQSLQVAANQIRVGESDIVAAGGIESMSMVPMGGNKFSANPYLMAERPEFYTPMGITAEIVAKRFEITRQMQDEMAYRSHIRGSAAIKDGKFKDEIVPVSTKVYEASGVKAVTVTDDEGPRADTTLEALAKLKPAFDSQGTVTAGNTSQVSDGAGAAILMADEVAKKKGLAPLAYIRGYAVAGVAPEVMGIGPVPAVRKLLQKTGLKISDIDLVELNEAFAAQGAYCIRELGLDVDKVNVNGGAIALGHPLGATGTVLTAKIVYELRRRKARYGIVTMCIGGGMGAAMLFERA